MTTAGLTACRSCGNTNLHQILSLGETPLANALRTADQLTEKEETFPLELVLCPECTLVQITETVSQEKLFREYLYRSSFSDTMLRHAADLAAKMIHEQGLGRQSLVVEVASNDGYLLRHYKSAGVRVLGIEPAINIARVAQQDTGFRLSLSSLPNNLRDNCESKTSTPTWSMRATSWPMWPN
jgi:hypothetical protein